MLPVLPAGKEPRNFGLHRVKQLAVVRQLTELIQLPPTTLHWPTRTRVLPTGAHEGEWGVGGQYPRRTRQHRTRPGRGTGQELAWRIAVIPPLGPA
jgi:hypothetical protein